MASFRTAFFERNSYKDDREGISGRSSVFVEDLVGCWDSNRTLSRRVTGDMQGTETHNAGSTQSGRLVVRNMVGTSHTHCDACHLIEFTPSSSVPIADYLARLPRSSFDPLLDEHTRSRSTRPPRSCLKPTSLLGSRFSPW